MRLFTPRKKENMPAFRHELKYLLSWQEAELLKHRLEPIMERDPHVDEDGEYLIRSLYFDDYFNSAYIEKEAGLYARKKYRIRIYNYSDSVISFERKTKYGQYIYKQSSRLTREECDMITGGEYRFLEKSSDPFRQELYVELQSRLLRPRVMVDYEREPFICEAGDVRITLDKHVRGSGFYDLFDPELPVTDVVPADRVILEVKFTQFLPSLIRTLLPPKSAENSAISKFVLCCGVAPREAESFTVSAQNSILKPV